MLHRSRDLVEYHTRNVANAARKAILWLWHESRYEHWHWAYFFIGSWIDAVGFKLAANEPDTIGWVHAWFMGMSAITGTGLAVLPMSSLNHPQQARLFVLFIFGCMPYISWWNSVCHYRFLVKYVKEHAAHYLRWQKDQKVMIAWRRDDEDRGRQTDRRSSLTALFDSTRSQNSVLPLYLASNDSALRHQHQFNGPPTSQIAGDFTFQNTGTDIPLDDMGMDHTVDIATIATGQDALDSVGSLRQTAHGRHAHSPTPIDHDTGFYPDSVTSIRHFEDSVSFIQQKEIVAERNAVGILCYLMPAYFFTYILFGYTVNIVQMNKYPLDVQQSWGVNKHWLAFFHSASAFTNAGMSLLDANMVAFNTDKPMLSYMSLQIIVGKTCFSIFVFIWIVVLWFLVRTFRRSRMPTLWLRRQQEDSAWLEEALYYLVTYPRRCSIHLCNRVTNFCLSLWFLLVSYTDFMAFWVGASGEQYTGGPFRDTATRFVSTAFQTFSVRMAGFNSESLADLQPALKLFLAFMIYMAVMPVAIASRTSNEYEDRSLSISRQEIEERADERLKNHPSILGTIVHKTGLDVKFPFLFAQASRRAVRDWWPWVFGAIGITISENFTQKAFTDADVVKVVFETASSYGNNGLSLGSGTGASYSYSGDLNTVSLLILIFLMWKGAQRLTPAASDRALMPPEQYVAPPESFTPYQAAGSIASREDQQPARPAVAPRRNSVAEQYDDYM